MDTIANITVAICALVGTTISVLDFVKRSKHSANA